MIRIFFAGDFVSGPSPSLIRIADDLKKSIESCQVRVVNFEVPLKPKDMERPMYPYRAYFQNDETPSFLKGLGFNVIPFCSNHTFDCKEGGYKKTKEALGECCFGSGTYDEAYKIKIVEIEKVKIGFMALCYAANQGVFNDVYNHDGLGCAYINDLRVNHDIIEAKKNVDFLFVLPHDGIEYIDAPLPETIARYRDFIDYGADGVIATHPHCPQGWEVYKGKPIFYSLANFFFNSTEDTKWVASEPHWYEGRCVIMEINRGDISCEVINTTNKKNESLVVDYSEESKKHNKYICDLLFNKNKYREYLLPVIEKQVENGEKDILKDYVINNLTFKTYIRLFIKFIACCIKGGEKKDSYVMGNRVLFLLKNDLRRSRLIRYLQNMSNLTID